MRRIAILGANGWIAKGLIKSLSYTYSGKYHTTLFTRNIDNVAEFMINNQIDTGLFDIATYDNLLNDKGFDAVINCTGIGDPKKIKQAGYSILALIGEFDMLCMQYASAYRDSVYINMSSGCVYGQNFGAKPVNEFSQASYDINLMKSDNLYMYSKLICEIHHRYASPLNIVDLRVFSYFSEFVDTKSGFLLSSMLDSLVNYKPFVTGDDNVMRDYIHPDDLLQLIECIIDIRKMNRAIDCYSKAPVSKLEILNHFQNVYKLQVKCSDDYHGVNQTGLKDNYYSLNHSANTIGYKPEYNSMETITEQTEKFLKKIHS